MTRKIAITTTSFAKADREPLDLLEKEGFSIVFNETARVLLKDEILNMLSDCAGIVAGTETYDQATLEKLRNLKVLSRCGVGMDSIDSEYCERNSIKLYNTGHTLKKAVAELVIGLIFNLLRQITAMDKDLRLGVWKKRMGSQFYGKNLGIIGFGRIGQEVGELAQALGAKVVYYDPFLKQEDCKGMKQFDLEDLLKVSDIVTLHLPLTNNNIDFIGEKEFKLMKKSSYLVNCSRGKIVNEEALYAALKGKRVAGAAIDVFEREPYFGPLTDLDNVILTPHVGSYAKEARVATEIEAAKNLIKGLRDR